MVIDVLCIEMFPSFLVTQFQTFDQQCTFTVVHSVLNTSMS